MNELFSILEQRPMDAQFLIGETGSGERNRCSGWHPNLKAN